MNNYGSVPLIGITIVLIALLCIAFLISLTSFIVRAGSGALKGGLKRKETTGSAGTKAGTAQAAGTRAADTKEEASLPEGIQCPDGELVAVITAAVLASMQSGSECKIRVRSIRRLPGITPVWNQAGRHEQLSGKL